MSTRSNDAPLMLSISGMRGLVGRSLTPTVAARFAAAYGTWLHTNRRPGHDPTSPPIVALGRDSRASGQMLEAAAAAGLASVGCRVVRVGVLSTPGVAIAMDHLAGDGGMVITASHNPFPWNGIKPLRYDGVAPPPDQSHAIIDRFKRDDVSFAEVAAIRPISDFAEGVSVHVDRVLERVDADLIRGAGLSCVVDSVHGAGGDEARALLDALGVRVTHLFAEPTGHFPHTPEPTKENLVELSEQTARAGADVGFAQDPDADRLAIVDEQGRYIGEEYTLALCAKHKLGPGEGVAANLSTSRMVDDVAQAIGGFVVRTAVGEANVTAGMRERGCTLGGEGNGGIIDNRVSQVRDSLIGMAYILEMLAAEKKTLSAIVAAMPAYAIVKDKADVDPAVLQTMPDKMRAAFADQRIDDQDGIRVDWDNQWVHVRPSNTEPIIRIIAEAEREADAKGLVALVRRVLGL
ncbi:MAG: phosphoglucosamine mutase [Planctomycetota bacterium]